MFARAFRYQIARIIIGSLNCEISRHLYINRGYWLTEIVVKVNIHHYNYYHFKSTK